MLGAFPRRFVEGKVLGRRGILIGVGVVFVFATLALGVQAQPGVGVALPPDVPIEVTLHLGAEPGKLHRITSTGMERELFPGMSATQRVQVRNASFGNGAAPVVFTGVALPVGDLQTGPVGQVTVQPGAEGVLSWTEAVAAGAEVGPFQNDVTLTRDGVVFARLRLKQGAGEPVKLRSFSYVNANLNDVGAYILFPGGTARLRFTVENVGDGTLTVAAEVEAEAGLSCSVAPQAAPLAPGASERFIVTCQAGPTLTDADDRVVVRFRRSG